MFSSRFVKGCVLTITYGILVTEGTIYRSANGPANPEYVLVEDPGMTRISVGADNILWGLKEDETVWQLLNNVWVQKPGRYAEFSALDRNTAWGVNKFGHVGRFDTSSWDRVQGYLVALGASRNDQTEYVWGYNVHNDIQFCAYDSLKRSCQWNKIERSPELENRTVVSVAATGDGKGFGLFEPRDQIGYPVYVYDKGRWTKLGESLLHLVGTAANYITGVNSRGEVRMAHMDRLNEWTVLDNFQTTPECATVGEQIWVLAGAYAQTRNNTVTYEQVFETVS
ncbi:hypothetical protein K7432_003284 [Basidiobolus ranarum]|uniref:Lectin n=1 Tax=Basidiobolus ranarum TaxID=34480 RepID=A0ABR2W6T7_9FUNG